MVNSSFRQLLAALLITASGCYAQVPSSPIEFVRPLIGSAPATTPSAQAHSESGSELKGQTVPMVGVPFGMTYWTPQTRAKETKCIAPYYYTDSTFQGFRGTHWLNGSCVQDYGSLTIMPLSGTLRTDPVARAIPFSHAQERSSPAYYALSLPEAGIEAQLTATARAGLLAFRFSKQEQHYVLVEVNSDEGQGYIEIDPERRQIRGYNPVHRIYQGWGESAGFSGYFVVQFDAPFEHYGLWQGNTLRPSVREYRGQGSPETVGGYVDFGSSPTTVTVRVGTSFVSMEGAQKNLDAEIGTASFETIQQQTTDRWNQSLSKMLVEGNSEQKTLFYSALYRSQLSPRLFSDVNGDYPSFAGGKQRMNAQGIDYYTDFSLWDTFRAAMPLHTLLEPTKTAHMMQSLTRMAEQGGWMPIFPCWNHYTAAMIGDHVMAVMADAYVKDVRAFDLGTAYRYLRKNAFEPNNDRESYLAGKGRRALTSYLKYNYIPLEDPVNEAFHKKEQVSRTLEYAYDDYCLSVLAKALGHTEDAALLQKRALNYQNVIDPTTGYARGRFADGRWGESDPFAKRASFITEGSPAQYTYFVPQDVGGLMRQMGGRDRFVAKLDTLFDQGHYWHGNEPNHQIAYLYAWAGESWNTQRRVRKIIEEEYSTSPGGLSGNEDGGQMSAWLVFSMAGLYPVCPGTPYYVLGSPAVEQVTLRLDSGKTFQIKARNNRPDRPYIQSAKLNGKPLTTTYLTHQQLQEGGTLELKMSAKPNKKQTWVAPPSLSR